MATASWSTVVDQSTDAAFRTWVAEFITKMAAVGMVQTADSGQINTSTVVRQASTNTAAGYTIWHTVSGNLYLKLEFGTGSTTLTFPSMWVTVGTGSDGAGTITGQTSTRAQIGRTAVAITSTVTNYQSYMCATGDYFGFTWKISSATTANLSRTLFVMQPTVDNNGARTTTGFAVTYITGAATATCQSVRTAATAVTGSQNTANFPCMLTNLITGNTQSTDGTNNQVWLHWWGIVGSAGCGASPLLYCGTILAAEAAIGTTFSATLVGSTSHTYISANTSTISFDAAQFTANPVPGLAIMFE